MIEQPSALNSAKPYVMNRSVLWYTYVIGQDVTVTGTKSAMVELRLERISEKLSDVLQ